MTDAHTHLCADAARYYGSPAVRDRIREYCGGSSDSAPTAAFIAQLAPSKGATWATVPRYPSDHLFSLLERGWDISRSFVDRESLIVFLEIDVGDPDAPGEVLLHPNEAFADVEPAYQALVAEFRRLELPLLDVMTGRGYHFVGRVPLTSRVVSWLAALAPEAAHTRIERAYTGLGMMLEYVAHNVHHAASSRGIPLVFNGVEVGRGGRGREAVSIDLSAYGDPIGERQMRVAYGTYQSHRIRPDMFGEDAASDVPIVVAVPRRGQRLKWMLDHARTTHNAAVTAASEHARLPNVTTGLENAVIEYEASLLRDFHRTFYGEAPHRPEEWAATYDRTVAQDLPPCVEDALRRPNDLLLKPTVVQHVTRYLMSRGWSPRHIAGLIWSKYATDHEWGDQWVRLDAQRRADFDVRVFAGMLITGIDEAVDFNCVSHQEKRACPGTGCPRDLREDREQLLRQL